MSLVLHYVYHLLLLIHEIVAFFKVTTALRLSQLDMPPTTVVGDTIEMSCLYELDNDSLYAVKWYKNGHEFFRFVPQDSPNGQYLKMDGVKVDLENSNHQTVILKDISLKSTGDYKCEVSTDAPSFVTLSMEKFMFVYALPKEGPAISGHKRFYRYGETININCSAAESKPTAIINWIINDKIQVDTINQQLVTSTILKTDRDNLDVQHTFGKGVKSTRLIYTNITNHQRQVNVAAKLAESLVNGKDHHHHRIHMINSVDANNTNSNKLNLINNEDLSISHSNLSDDSATLTSATSSQGASNQSLNLEYTVANLQLTVDDHLIDFLLSMGYKSQTGIVLQLSTSNGSNANENNNENYSVVSSDRNKHANDDTQEKVIEQHARARSSVSLGRAGDRRRTTEIRVDGMTLKIKCLSSLNEKFNFYTMSDEIRMILITKEWPQTRLNVAVDDDDIKGNQLDGQSTGSTRRFMDVVGKDSAQGLTSGPVGGVTVILGYILTTTTLLYLVLYN